MMVFWRFWPYQASFKFSRSIDALSVRQGLCPISVCSVSAERRETSSQTRRGQRNKQSFCYSEAMDIIRS